MTFSWAPSLKGLKGQSGLLHVVLPEINSSIDFFYISTCILWVYNLLEPILFPGGGGGGGGGGGESRKLLMFDSKT